jgi:hypothetical protein
MTTPEQLAAASKVWMYQSSRPLSPEEQQRINVEMQAFSRQWTAHNQQLKAWGGVLEDRVLVLMVDETVAGASGCSIDKSVHFMQDLEAKFGIQLFDRMLLSFKNTDGNVETIPAAAISEKIEAGALQPHTPVINMLAASKAEIDTRFFIPFKDSWAGAMFL